VTRTHRLLPAVLLAALSIPVYSPPTHAVAYWGTYSSTLWNTPSQYFTDQDWQLFDDTLKSTLDAAPDGQPRAWSNPASKAAGEFTVLKSLQHNGKDCRQVKIVSSAGGLRRVTGIAFCKDEEAGWQAIPGKGVKANR